MRIGQQRMTELQIEEVVQMRLAGHSFSEIGRIFGKDHTTIMYHCKKAGLFVSQLTQPTSPIRRVVIQIKRIQPYVNIDNEVMNPGKNYADYLKEEKKRNWKKRNDIASV